MVLLIEAPETIRVIEELSRRTGRAFEREVDIAVRERLARLRTPEEEAERRARVYEAVKQLQTAVKESGVAVPDHGELLYDENGLPREGELSEIELKFYFPERYTPSEEIEGDEAWHSRSKPRKPFA